MSVHEEVFLNRVWETQGVEGEYMPIILYYLAY